MATYVLPPGAWLSGSALHPGIGGQSPLHPGIGGQSPLHPGIGGQSPLHPGIGGQSPLHPGIGAQSPLQPGIGGNSPWLVGADANTPATSLAAAASRLTVAAPWRGNDPAWIYGNAEGAMLAAAINRVRSRLVRPADVRIDGDTASHVAHQPDSPDGVDPLWRWGREPRMLAVVSDLNWRFSVGSSSLWYVYRANDSGRELEVQESLTYSTFPKYPAWFTEQIDKVLRAAVEREDRMPEILSQADDFMPFFIAFVGVSPATAPITFELLEVAMRWATPIVMAIKNQVAGKRPHAASSRIVPVIETPPHSALPSGHATTATLMSELLGELMFGLSRRASGLPHPKAEQLDRLARRIAFNRVVSGVHFPIDSRAGYALGLQLAAHFIGLASGQPQPDRYDLALGKPGSHDLSEVKPRVQVKLREINASGAAGSHVLGVMWRAACRELRQLGFEEVPA